MAMDHMISSPFLYTSAPSIINSNIKLPNGHFVPMTHRGIVRISASLILKNVLCVSSFKFNLISVSKITPDSLCCLLFFSQYYFMQDLFSWKTIGVAKSFQGIYYLLQDLAPSTKTISSHSLASSCAFNSI